MIFGNLRRADIAFIRSVFDDAPFKPADEHVSLSRGRRIENRNGFRLFFTDGTRRKLSLSIIAARTKSLYSRKEQNSNFQVDMRFIHHGIPLTVLWVQDLMMSRPPIWGCPSKLLCAFLSLSFVLCCLLEHRQPSIFQRD